MNQSLVNLIRSALKEGYKVELVVLANKQLVFDVLCYERSQEQDFVDFSDGDLFKIQQSISIIRHKHPFPRVLIWQKERATKIVMRTKKSKGKEIPIR